MDASYVFSWVIDNIIAPIVVGVLLIALEKIFEMNHQKTKKKKKGLTNDYYSDRMFRSSARGVFLLLLLKCTTKTLFYILNLLFFPALCR